MQSVKSMTKIKLKDIAEQAGVSITTVSRVLKGEAAQHRIKQQTEQRVIDAAEKLGFTPCKTFYKPERLRSRSIGLVIPDISHHFLGNLAKTITSQANKSDYAVIICDSMEDTKREIKSIELLLGKNVDGLIILPVGKQDNHIINVYNQGVPLVVADRVFPNLDCVHVCIDNYQAAHEATLYLVENGHQHIACVQRLPEAWINNERVRAYTDVLTQFNIPVDPTLITGDTFGQKNGYLEVKLLLNRPQKPTAVFALSHLAALGAIRAIREEGLTIPDDISLVAFDDLPFPEYFSPPVTTVQQPCVEMGLVALNLLLEQIDSNQRKAPLSIKLPTHLIHRKSVRRIN